MSNDNEDKKFSQLPQRPPQMFFGNKERDLVHQVNTELTERIIGQEILYYPLSIEHSNYHDLYGESLIKNFFAPVHVHVLVEWEGQETETTGYGIDRKSSIVVHFNHRRVSIDRDLYVREGDFVLYGNRFYEIVELNEPREIFGNTKYKVEISAKCIRAREGTFDAT